MSAPPDPATAEIWLTPHERLLNACAGTVVGTIAVPLIVANWAPTWFALGWGLVFGLCSIGFIIATLRRSSPVLETISMTTIATLFSVQLVSSIVWSDQLSHFWAALVITLAYLIFEVSALPFIDIAEWRIGFAIVALAIAVTAGIAVHPAVGMLFPVISLTTGMGVKRLRDLKGTLEHDLATVQAQATSDDLTGLLNRRGIQRALTDAVAGRCTVVMVDVDRFKQINDTHGYGVGDQVLAEVAAQLKARLPAPFVLGRQGGDEFVAVAPEHVSVSDHLSAPFVCELNYHGHALQIDVELSAGMTYSAAGAEVDRVLSEAGFALRDAKRSRRLLARFAGVLQGRFDRSLQIAALTDGDDTTGRGELVPYGQVIVDRDGHIRGIEMLIRWRQPDGRMIRPADFLPMAVENGSMGAINDLMLDHAIAFAARFNNRPNAPFVSVNITATHLARPDFAEAVSERLAAHRVEPDRLMIEITESEQVHRDSGWARTVEDLRRRGIRLAIDDFGSGYSSIERLQTVPITHLKFDRTLVRAITGPFGEIAYGVVRFGDQTQIGIVAEGIETFDELLSVQALGISLFQGFLFGRPAPLDDLERRVLDEFNPTVEGQAMSADASLRSYHD